MPSESGGGPSPNRCGITGLLRANAVNGAAGGDPRVIRRARAVLLLVPDDPWVAADVECARRVLEQVRIVLLFPHEDQVRGRHEVGDVRTAARRTREGIGADAPPAAMIGVVVVGPELFLLDEGLLVDGHSPLHADRVAGKREMAATRAGSRVTAISIRFAALAGRLAGSRIR